MCYKPINLKSGGQFPCGRCARCVKRRLSGWAFRLAEELKVSESAHFITLTYDTDYVPISSNGFLTLRKRDLQLFFKRLRQAHVRDRKRNKLPGDPASIRYYACGEYGDRSRRPHYHLLLFNAKLELIEGSWRSEHGEPIGNIHYGKVSDGSIGYTLKYMCKDKKAFRLSKRDDRAPQFACMSKGIGLSYLNETMVNYHAQDLIGRLFVSRPGNVKLSMPRYYKDKMYLELERAAISEAYALISEEKQLARLERETSKDFRARMEAIEASYKRMYSSSQKTLV